VSAREAAGQREFLILPAYDEGERIGQVLDRVRDADLSLTCVVVDDGSSDDTAERARERGAVVLRHPFNLGYGAALQTGYKYALAAGADRVVQMDADGQHDPSLIPRLVDRVASGQCDLVIGSRFLEPGGYQMQRLRRLGRGLFRGVARMLGLSITDPTSGFQAMNRAVLELYVSDDFPTDYPDVDVLVTVHRNRLVVGECPVTMRAETRQSRMHGGLRSIYYVYKMLLSLWAATRRVPTRR
jgi:glycosyltransferase involved in cell wall biosynthesis